VPTDRWNAVGIEGHFSEEMEAGQNAHALLHFNSKHEKNLIA
jgi:hypothetical protein